MRDGAATNSVSPIGHGGGEDDHVRAAAVAREHSAMDYTPAAIECTSISAVLWETSSDKQIILHSAARARMRNND